MSIFLIELAVNLFAQCIELLSFEVGDGHALPSTAGAIERRVHQLQHRLFAEGVRNRLYATTLLAKQSFHEIGGPRGPPMRHRQLQVGHTHREVIVEAFDRAGQAHGMRRTEVRGRHLGDLRAGGVIGCQRL